MTGEQQDTILAHIRGSVFSTESGSIDHANGEYLILSANMYGKLDIEVNKSGLSVSGLSNTWNTHQSTCTDGCKEWSL